MRLCLIFCALLLSACGHDGPFEEPPPSAVPEDLLRPCPGYTGPLPRTEGQLSDAVIAEARGRACANARIEAIAAIVRR